jgi:hypothetical protein
MGDLKRLEDPQEPELKGNLYKGDTQSESGTDTWGLWK